MTECTQPSFTFANHLYRLEKGLQSMTLVTLKTIADTLEVRVVQLLRGF